MIKVLVVDDSAFIRKALSRMLETDPEIKVIGTAHDGETTLKKTKELKPDIITLDLDMRGMDGLSILKQIMIECPTPVIIVSSLASEGAQITLDALQIGAIDFVPKEISFISAEIIKIQKQLIEKIKYIAKIGLKPHFKRIINQRTQRPRIYNLPTHAKSIFKLIAIGTSTGGPIALQSFLPQFPDNFPVPILIVQHMPPGFTKNLASRLNGLSNIKVIEAEDGMRIEPKYAYIAPGYAHMLVKREQGYYVTKLSEYPADIPHVPSVDILFESVADYFPGNSIAVILTGMGNDGLRGAYQMKDKKSIIITETEESCVVYGMPKAVNEAGLSDFHLPLTDIPKQIIKLVMKN
ncbi:MAG: chemotaxis response regulator protein-glutamate methylesterase [Candidatus Coatesbacteria bacterium]|nr:chemotaxis response regulator protein-glutamate methylesterase [Candidatus Coatesbacteria bacterium]